MKIVLLKWKLQYSQTPLTLIKVQIYLNTRSDKTCLTRNNVASRFWLARNCRFALLSPRFCRRAFVLRARVAVP